MTLKVYTIVTNDTYELPVCSGLVGAEAVAKYLGLSVSSVRKHLCLDNWSKKAKYKAVIDTYGTAEEIRRRRVERCKKQFMTDRSEYFREHYRRKKNGLGKVV